MTIKRKKKKLKLRYEGIKILSYSLFIIFIIIYIIVNIIKIYNYYQYKKTDEYKIKAIGYTLEETKDFLNIMNDEIKEFILNNPKEDLYYKIIKQKYFLTKNYLKYIDYQKSHPDTDLNTIVALVNTHASEGWYTNTYKTDLSKNNLILVNKFYQLKENYEREDLVNISLQYSFSGNQAAKEVVEKYIEMHKKAKEELGVTLMVNSSYRSYQKQNEVYKQYKSKGQEYADSYAARPGFSEHQTGLALDIFSLTHPTINTFKESEEYNWLKENCYKYGFILRYPEGKENITGYSTESWHFRYVGEKVAAQIKQEDITFDEYYAYYIER